MRGAARTLVCALVHQQQQKASPYCLRLPPSLARTRHTITRFSTGASSSSSSYSCESSSSSAWQNNNNNPPDDDNGTTTVTKTRYTINTPRTNPIVLRCLVEKHVLTLDRYLQNKPLADHTSQAFATLYEQFQQPEHSQILWKNQAKQQPRRIILDSGCGTGRSSLYLGQQHPEAIIVGVDKSLARLSRQRPSTKSTTNHQPTPEETMVRRVADNVWLVRAELVDFWRCCGCYPGQLAIDEHYLLYPNPYPKPDQVQRRWYAHPSFPLLLQLAHTKRMVIRSNWKVYLEELAEATRMVEQIMMVRSIANNETKDVRFSSLPWRGPVIIHGPTRRIPTTTLPAMTNFEAKYDHVGEPTYELILEWNNHDDD